MAGLQKSKSPEPELSHSTTDRWPAGSHQHWNTGLSPSACIWLYLSHPSHHKPNLTQSLSQIHGIYLLVCSNAPILPLDLILFRQPLSVFKIIMSTTLQLNVVPGHKPLQFTKQINSPASVLSCINTKMVFFFFFIACPL